MILILILYMLLASTFTLGKAILLYVKPLFFIGIRMVMGGSLLLTYAALFKRSWFHFNTKHFWLFVQIVILHIYLGYTLEFIGLRYVSSAKVCLLYNLSPFITALLTYLFFGERLKAMQWLGLIIGFVGFLPLFLDSSTSLFGFDFSISLPELLITGAVMASCYGWIIMKRLGAEGYSPVIVNGIGMFFGGLLSLFTSAVWGESPLFLPGINGVFPWGQLLIYTILLIMISNVIFYNFYGYLLYRYSPTYLSFLGFTCPLFASLYGMVFLHEKVSGWFFVTVAVVALGLYIFYSHDLKNSFKNEIGPQDEGLL